MNDTICNSRGLNRVRKNEKGFTLMEMLIVVAIIAVLVAIMIPALSGSLIKAKVSADMANVRSFYAEQMIEYLDSDNAGFAEYPAENGGTTKNGTFYPALNYSENLTQPSDSDMAYSYDPDTSGSASEGKTSADELTLSIPDDGTIDTSEVSDSGE